MDKVNEQGHSWGKEGLGEGASAYHEKRRRMFLNSHPRKHLVLAHHQMGKVLMHNFQLIDRYIFLPCVLHPTHTSVGTSIGIGGGVGGC